MYYILLLLLISILPVYLIGLYVYKKDNQKEPIKLLKKLFIYGVLSCIPVAIIEVALEPFFGTEESRSLIMWFIYAISSVALIEELFKWLIVYKVSYNHKEFDQVYDAIVYAVFVSLGFAFFENIFYVFDSGLAVGFIRAVTAIPGHASDAIIMGNYLGLAKLADINKNRKLRNKNLLLSIFMPTLLHALYDYFLFTENYIMIIMFFLLLIFIYVYSIKKVKRVAALRQNIYKNNSNNDLLCCSNCGTVGYGNFCVMCGTKLNNNYLNNDNNLTH